MVEVQKPMVFCDFCGARATLCGDRRGRGAKTHGFLRFLTCSRDPLRGSAWSRCRLLLFELVLGSCLVVRAPAPGNGGSRVRFLPGPRAGVARCNLHFSATCAEQLAQSKLHRATCADQLAPTSLRRAPCLEQLAQSNLRRATCTEQLAQSSLHRATCRERNLHRATCRHQLAGATCAEQLAQSNLHSATCVEQLAQTNLHRPVCAEHLAWCCLALASRSVGKKNASCSVGPTSLAMFCFRANRGLVCTRAGCRGLNFNGEPFAGHHLGGDSCALTTFEGGPPFEKPSVHGLFIKSSAHGAFRVDTSKGHCPQIALFAKARARV